MKKKKEKKKAKKNRVNVFRNVARREELKPDILYANEMTTDDSESTTLIITGQTESNTRHNSFHLFLKRS